MTLTHVYSGTDDEQTTKKPASHGYGKSKFPTNKRPGNYAVTYDNGTTCYYQYCTGDEIRQLANGRNPISYRKV